MPLVMAYLLSFQGGIGFMFSLDFKWGVSLTVGNESFAFCTGGRDCLKNKSKERDGVQSL